MVHVALSPGLSDLVAVTDTAQAFRIARPTTRPLGEGKAPAQPPPLPRAVQPLLAPHHSGAITGLSLCVRKPLAATCGADRSIRLWNLLTLRCELVVYFPELPLSLSFHPSGLHLLVGFADKLRLCNVLLNEIRAYRELPIKACAECAFSHGGQSFAAVNGTLVQVYDTYTGEQLAVFRGHTGLVRSLSWSADDLRLVSAGVDGAVYQRRLGSSARVQELVQKGCRFSSALLTDGERMYAVGDDRMLKEIVDRSVAKTLDAGCVLTVIAADHAQPTSRLIAGTENGVLRSFAFPLTGLVKDYQCHCRAVTRLALSHDDRFLVSASEDGSVAVFNAQPPPPPSSGEASATLALPIPLSSAAALSSPDAVAWSDDVLVSRASLDDASHLLLELRGRVDELQASNDYQLRLHEMNYSEKVKEVAEKYALQLEHDRSKVELITDEKTEMEAECASRLRTIRDAHQQKLGAEDRGHQQSLLSQIATYAQLQDQLEQQSKEGEHSLSGLDGGHRAAMERLAEEWRLRLDAASSALATQRRSVERVAREYEETRAQSSADQDAEVEAVKAGYSARLLSERDSLLRFKGELGIMRKKLAALLKDIDEQKDALKHSAEREDALLHAIAALDSRIAAQRASMADKDRAIADSERAIAELKKDNGELEKFKFVLDYQIKQLKRQIEPREADIADIRRHIGAIDGSLEREHKANAAVHRDIAALQRSNARRQSAVHRSRDATRSLQRRLAVARRRLAECTAALDEPRRLQAAFEALCRDVLLPPPQLQQQQQQQQRASEPSASAPPSSSPSADSAEVQSEFGRQRAALLRRVADLSTELSAAWRTGRKGNVAVMQSNVALIREVQRGRRPGPQPSQPQQPQPPHSRTAAQSSHPQRPSQQPSVAAASEALQRAEEDSAAQRLHEQRAHIVALRERLHALTAAPRDAEP